MAEYIDRDRFADKIREHLRCSNKGSVTEAAYAAMLQDLEGLPVVDVAPVVHGRWDKCGATRHKNHCTRCGSERPYRKIGRGYYLVWDSPYCPHCGAKMDGGEKDAEVQA